MHSLHQQAMGTHMVFKVIGARAQAALQKARREIKAIESGLSVFNPASDIARINRAAGRTHQKISPETLFLLKAANRFSTIAPDCFDISIQPLVALWNHCRDAGQTPDPDQIKRMLALVNARDLHLETRHSTAFLQQPGQAIDLGGIAKGYAGDRIRAILQDQGITSAYANLGGNVITLGKKPDGTPWQVGIQHPRREQGLIGAIPSMDEAIATSGDYQQFFTDQHGQRWHHILNPATGFPAQTGLISVTIIAQSALTADALSTLIFVAGIERGLAILETIPKTEAILITKKLQVLTTSGLKNRFRPGPGVNHINIQKTVSQ